MNSIPNLQSPIAKSAKSMNALSLADSFLARGWCMWLSNRTTGPLVSTVVNVPSMTKVDDALSWPTAPYSILYIGVTGNETRGHLLSFPRYSA